jgi:hypothetical protein
MGKIMHELQIKEFDKFINRQDLQIFKQGVGVLSVTYICNCTNGFFLLILSFWREVRLAHPYMYIDTVYYM